MASFEVLQSHVLLGVALHLYEIWYQLPLLLLLVALLLDDVLKKTKLLHHHHHLLEVADLMKMIRLPLAFTKRAEF